MTGIAAYLFIKRKSEQVGRMSFKLGAMSIWWPNLFGSGELLASQKVNCW